MFFFVWFLIPETKGLSLEKMDDLFGVTAMAHKGDVESNTGSIRGTNVNTNNEKAAAAIPDVEAGNDNLRKREVTNTTTEEEHIEHAGAPNAQVHK